MILVFLIGSKLVMLLTDEAGDELRGEVSRWANGVSLVSYPFSRNLNFES